MHENFFCSMYEISSCMKTFFGSMYEIISYMKTFFGSMYEISSCYDRGFLIDEIMLYLIMYELFHDPYSLITLTPRPKAKRPRDTVKKAMEADLKEVDMNRRR